MKVGLLGGTFDPVHNGHLELAEEALRQLKLDRVYLVLSPLSPFKTEKDLTPVDQRLAMLKLAVKGRKNIAVGEWELKRRGPCYTVQTLVDYKKLKPSHELFLIMGSDAFSGFKNWKNPKKIMKLAALVVGKRPSASGTMVFEGIEGGRLSFLKGIFPEISSTQIRAAAQRGRVSSILVPPPVSSFIQKNKLYA